MSNPNTRQQVEDVDKLDVLDFWQEYEMLGKSLGTRFK